MNSWPPTAQLHQSMEDHVYSVSVTLQILTGFKFRVIAENQTQKITIKVKEKVSFPLMKIVLVGL